MQNDTALNSKRNSVKRDRSNVLLTILMKLGLDEGQEKQDKITLAELKRYRQQVTQIARCLPQNCPYCVITEASLLDGTRTFKILKHLNSIEASVRREEERAIQKGTEEDECPETDEAPSENIVAAVAPVVQSARPGSARRPPPTKQVVDRREVYKKREVSKVQTSAPKSRQERTAVKEGVTSKRTVRTVMAEKLEDESQGGEEELALYRPAGTGVPEDRTSKVYQEIDTNITPESLQREHAFLQHEVIRLRDVLQDAVNELSRRAGKGVPARPGVECGGRTAAPQAQLDECIKQLSNVRRFLDECAGSDGFSKLMELLQHPARCCDLDDEMFHIHGFLGGVPIVVNLDPEGKLDRRRKPSKGDKVLEPPPVPEPVEPEPVEPEPEEPEPVEPEPEEPEPLEPEPVEPEPVEPEPLEPEPLEPDPLEPEPVEPEPEEPEPVEPEPEEPEPVEPEPVEPEPVEPEPQEPEPEPRASEPLPPEPAALPPADGVHRLKGSPSKGMPYYPTVKSLPQADKYMEGDAKEELMALDKNVLALAAVAAPCCRQTFLDESSDEELPYSVSLMSLPLDKSDYEDIRARIKKNQKADKDVHHLHPKTENSDNLIDNSFGLKQGEKENGVCAELSPLPESNSQ
ncbi:uncharacterized abhydrolase domain-containing protein DDB_G0269086-like [Bacillus rossius redtenbacheri]|uniref:uncharacterized abhydrolase domain-containing protein DDB_G0269086-like n=1 Tax=Bacillus rossius redtenbacheri TaxID=93214 RepID=UPI002FDEBFC6